MSKKKDNEEQSLLSDLVKKIVSSPDQVVQKITATTGEITQTIKGETKKFLDKIDPSKEIEKILDKYDFEISATVRLKKKPVRKKRVSKTKK